MRISVENMEMLKEQAENVLSVWEEISDSVESWMDLQDEEKNEDINEEIRSHREIFTDGLDALADAAFDIALLIRGAIKMKAMVSRTK